MTEAHRDSSVDVATASPDARLELNAKARSGTIWIVTAFGAGQIIRLATNIVLAALLLEEAFALMALVNAVLIGLAMFSDLGFQQNVVQSPRGDEPAFLNTVWTMQVIRGALLTLAAMAVAWPMAAFYGANDPSALELRWLIPIAAVTALLDGLRSPAVYSAFRHMQVAKLTRIEIVVTLVNTVLILGLTWYTRSVYALVISAVVSSALHTALTYWWLPRSSVRFTWERAAVRSIFSFGKWIFVSTLLFFLSLQIDRLTFSAMFPLSEVGVYQISASLALVVTMLMGQLQGSVVFPWYARMLQQGMDLPQAFAKAKLPILLVSTYLVALLAAGADSFFRFAYDDRYAQAAVFLPILAIGVWFGNVSSLYGSAFLVKGQSRWMAMVSAVKVLAFVLFVAALSQFGGSLTLAAGLVVLCELLAALTSVLIARRLELRSIVAETLALVALLATLATCHLLFRYVDAIGRLHPLLQLILLGTLITLLFSPFLLRQLRPFVRSAPMRQAGESVH